jgi:hypothetical protein
MASHLSIVPDEAVGVFTAYKKGMRRVETREFEAGARGEFRCPGGNVSRETFCKAGLIGFRN